MSFKKLTGSFQFRVRWGKHTHPVSPTEYSIKPWQSMDLKSLLPATKYVVIIKSTIDAIFEHLLSAGSHDKGLTGIMVPQRRPDIKVTQISSKFIIFTPSNISWAESNAVQNLEVGIGIYKESSRKSPLILSWGPRKGWDIEEKASVFFFSAFFFRSLAPQPPINHLMVAAAIAVWAGGKPELQWEEPWPTRVGKPLGFHTSSHRKDMVCTVSRAPASGLGTGQEKPQ